MKKYFWMLMVVGFGSHAQDWQAVQDMAPDSAKLSDFGVGMVFADDYLVVGWPKTFDLSGPASECGEVITYVKSGDVFEEVDRITAADLTGSCVPGDGFGYGLSYDQGRLAIGMPAGARTGVNLPGGGSDADSRVFVTRFENGSWSLQQELQANDLGNGRGMGFQLVIENDLLLVHAHEYDSIFGFAFPVSTGVYVFEDSGNGFAEQQKLTESHHLFGQDFDTENGQIVVGAWGEQVIGAAGKIFVYENQGGSWALTQTINDSRNKNLGNQIEIHQNTLVAGSVDAGGIGAVVVYSNDSGSWQESQFIQASDAAINDQFGLTVRLDSGELMIGATAGTNQVQTLGAVYQYKLNSQGMYEEQQKIETPNQNEAADQFGANLIFNQTDLLVTDVTGGVLEGSISNFWHFSREAGNETPVAQVNQTTSGIWQPEGINGQSMNLEILDASTALMYLNQATDQGTQWLFSVGQISGNQISFDTIYRNTGPVFGADYASSDLVYETVGNANFSLNACGAGTLQLSLTGTGDQSIGLVQTSGITGLDCQSSTKVLANGISGSWFNPERAGEGFSVYTHGNGAAQTATVHWYTYDNNGLPMVLMGEGAVTDSTISIDELRQYGAGSSFTTTAPSNVVGSLNMSWSGCAQAMFDYDLSAVDSGTGGYALIQLTQVKDSDCQ